jgi:hypothetical protein
MRYNKPMNNTTNTTPLHRLIVWALDQEMTVTHLPDLYVMEDSYMILNYCPSTGYVAIETRDMDQDMFGSIEEFLLSV